MSFNTVVEEQFYDNEGDFLATLVRSSVQIEDVIEVTDVPWAKTVPANWVLTHGAKQQEYLVEFFGCEQLKQVKRHFKRWQYM